MADNQNNILYPLFDSLYNCINIAKNYLNKLPTKIDYHIDTKLYCSNSLFLPIGVNKNKVQYLKIGGENSHTYIVGQSGSGKSNLVKVILSTIVNNYPTTELILFDYKRVELSLFKNTSNCIRFEWDTDQISKGLKDLYGLVLDRYDILASNNLTIANNTMNNIVVVCEEISLMPKADMKILRKIMAISRAVNVYAILTTQRPSNECLDNIVKSLVENRICLKTSDSKNSIIALDTVGCELLRGQGNGFIKANGYIKEFQSYYISDTVVNEICSKHSKAKGTQYPFKKVTDTNNNDNWWCDL